MARAQKQDELQQLLSLLQLSNLAAEPQLKQEQMADSRRGQDLQTVLGLLGLQQSGEAEKAHAQLALQQLTQQGQQFGEGQKLSREQLAQTGELAAKDFALRGDANTLGHEKLAQEGEQFNVAQHNDLHKMQMQRDMQEKLAALGLSGDLLRNPMYSDKPEMLKSLVAHSDNPALGLQEGQNAELQNKVSSTIAGFKPNSSHDDIIKQISALRDNPPLVEALKKHWGLTDLEYKKSAAAIPSGTRGKQIIAPGTNPSYPNGVYAN